MRRGLRLREGLLGILVQVGHNNPRCELQKNHTGTFLHLALGEEGGNTCSAATRLAPSVIISILRYLNKQPKKNRL